MNILTFFSPKILSFHNRKRFIPKSSYYFWGDHTRNFLTLHGSIYKGRLSVRPNRQQQSGDVCWARKQASGPASSSHRPPPSPLPAAPPSITSRQPQPPPPQPCPRSSTAQIGLGRHHLSPPFYAPRLGSQPPRSHRDHWPQRVPPSLPRLRMHRRALRLLRREPLLRLLRSLAAQDRRRRAKCHQLHYGKQFRYQTHFSPTLLGFVHFICGLHVF